MRARDLDLSVPSHDLFMLLGTCYAADEMMSRELRGPVELAQGLIYAFCWNG